MVGQNFYVRGNHWIIYPILLLFFFCFMFHLPWYKFSWGRVTPCAKYCNAKENIHGHAYLRNRDKTPENRQITMFGRVVKSITEFCGLKDGTDLACLFQRSWSVPCSWLVTSYFHFTLEFYSYSKKNKAEREEKVQEVLKSMNVWICFSEQEAAEKWLSVLQTENGYCRKKELWRRDSWNWLHP